MIANSQISSFFYAGGYIPDEDTGAPRCNPDASVHLPLLREAIQRESGIAAQQQVA